MKDFEYFIPIDIYNNTRAERVSEPVKIDLLFDVFKPNEEGIDVKDQEGNEITFQTFNCIKENNNPKTKALKIKAIAFSPDLTLRIATIKNRLLHIIATVLYKNETGSSNKNQFPSAFLTI